MAAGQVVTIGQKSYNCTAEETKSNSVNGEKWEKDWKYEEVATSLFLYQNLMISAIDE